MLGQLAPNINTGTYTVILGEDVSGRIPALIIRRVINEIYQRLGFPPLTTFFFAGYKSVSLQTTERETKKQFEDLVRRNNFPKKTSTEKALVVTDVVKNGDHLCHYLDVLNDLGINFDVATIGFYEYGKRFLENELRVMVYGGRMNYTPLLWYNKGLQGVRKLPNSYPPFSHPNPTQSSLEARRDVETLASELVQWYLQECLPQPATAVA